MSENLERILLVEDDPEISDLIIRGSLQPLGYQVFQVESASEAIKSAIHNNPDLIIADLELPDLSGKDLLVALASQGIETPMILLAKKGKESDIIQAFRLGAADYVHWPARETEILSAVERILKQVRAREDKERLAAELDETNKKLQHRLKELKTILAIGKTVTSVKRQRELFEKVVEGGVYVTEADLGWLLIREGDGEEFILRAQMNLPSSYVSRLNRIWNDSLTSLVALSKESLEISGPPLNRFEVAKLGKAALVVPLKMRNEVAGLLVVMRKAANPFTQNNQVLLEAIADYAAISLVNIKLFQALEARAQSLEIAAKSAEQSEQEKETIFGNINQEIKESILVAEGYISMLIDGQLGDLTNAQIDTLRLSQDGLRAVLAKLDRQGYGEANYKSVEDDRIVN
jgi:two-component system NtrC family sensor kinase